MARIPLLNPSEAPEEARELLGKLPDLNVFKALAHSPAALDGFVRMGNALLYRGALDPGLRELVILRVGHLCKAPYEIHQHEDAARQVGVSETKIAATATGPSSEAFTQAERLALRFTDEVAHLVKATDETFEAVCGAFDHAQIVELTLCVGYYMMVSRFLETLEIEIETPGTEGLKFD